MSAAVVDFDYDVAGGLGAWQEGLRSRSGLTASIMADRAYLRADLAEDAGLAGLRLLHSGGLHPLDGAPLVGDIVLVDCPQADDAERMDMLGLGRCVAKSGAQLVVSTTFDSLEAVFGCLPQRAVQILVAPSRSERLIALGRALPLAANRVRELSDEDRMALLRLTEEIAQMASRLERLTAAPSHALPSVAQASSPFQFGETREVRRNEEGSERLLRATRPALPDPRLVRRIIRQRQHRAHFFDGELFADPAWDMLLDLTAARVEHLRVSVTSLCIASGVPPSTALRWIGQLIDAGLLQRVDDETDRRRAFIALTEKAADAMAGYFAELGPMPNVLV